MVDAINDRATADPIAILTALEVENCDIEWAQDELLVDFVSESQLTHTHISQSPFPRHRITYFINCAVLTSD
jgi:hypothetical protein